MWDQGNDLSLGKTSDVSQKLMDVGKMSSKNLRYEPNRPPKSLGLKRINANDDFFPMPAYRITSHIAYSWQKIISSDSLRLKIRIAAEV